MDVSKTSKAPKSASVHVHSLLGATSELIVSDRSILFTPELLYCARHNVVVHGQWTDAAVGDERALGKWSS